MKLAGHSRPVEYPAHVRWHPAASWPLPGKCMAFIFCRGQREGTCTPTRGRCEEKRYENKRPDIDALSNILCMVDGTLLLPDSPQALVGMRSQQPSCKQLADQHQCGAPALLHKGISRFTWGPVHGQPAPIQKPRMKMRQQPVLVMHAIGKQGRQRGPPRTLCWLPELRARYWSNLQPDTSRLDQ